MRLTIVNSTAPGTASLLAPFFAAIADRPGFELTVLEQVSARGSGFHSDPSDGERRYHVTPIRTLWYNRRHACARQPLAEARGKHWRAWRAASACGRC